MALQIVNAGPPVDEIIADIQKCIEDAVPEAAVDVSSAAARHFEIKVTSPAFEGKNRVKQQQLVYGAIAHLMAGGDAPVHAIDRLECVVP